MMKSYKRNQFTGNETHPQCNRKFCQFNKEQYCITVKPYPSSHDKSIINSMQTAWIRMGRLRLTRVQAV